MQNIKTAISIKKPLFEQTERLARKMKISRSRLVGLALEEYLRRHENHELLAQLNAAYVIEPDESEKEYRRRVRRSHRRMVEGTWSSVP
jgi:metal-responsive CopG/Arc/MetJ family transcriptional regulator